MEGATKMLLIMLSINIFLWLGQSALFDINPDGTTVFFDVNDSPISNYMVDGQFNASDDVMPDLTSGSSESTGSNFFTDAISNIKSWFSEKLAPINFIFNFFTAPTDFMKLMGFPLHIATAFGILWYVLGVFILIMLIFGRGTT